MAIVLAVLLVAGGGAIGIFLGTSGSKGAKTVATQSPSTAPSATGPVVPAAPALFVAEAKSGGEVDLTWTGVHSQPSVTGYTIYKDGQILKLVNAVLVSYTDFDVLPGRTYTYEIAAESSAGSSERATQTVDTPDAPSISSARLTGHFDVSGKYTSENYTNYSVGDKYVERWYFIAQCPESKGACNVKTAADGNRYSVLKRKGASYNGTVTVPDLGRCGSIKLDEYYDLSFSVTKAAFHQGVWTATKVKGTLVVNGQSSSQCVTGHATITFTATWAD